MIDIVLSKKFSELTEDEKKFCVRELTVFQNSDEWTNLISSLEKTAEKLLKDIRKAHNDKNRDRTMVASQLDRELATIDFMESIASKLGDSNGAKIFKLGLESAVKTKIKASDETIEPMYDQLVFTELDEVKHTRVLNLSVKMWLTQSINQHGKEPGVPEEKGAY